MAGVSWCLVLALHLAALPLLAVSQLHGIGDSVANSLGLGEDRIPKTLENGSVIMEHTRAYRMVADIPYDAWSALIYSLHGLALFWLLVGSGTVAVRACLVLLLLGIQWATLILTDVAVLGLLEFISLPEVLLDSSQLFAGIPLMMAVIFWFLWPRRQAISRGLNLIRVSVSDILGLVAVVAVYFSIERFRHIEPLWDMRLAVIAGLTVCLAIWLVSPIDTSRCVIGFFLTIAFGLIPAIMVGGGARCVLMLFVAAFTSASVMLTRQKMKPHSNHWQSSSG